MRIVQQLLSLVVASGFVLNATASHKSREFGVCEDRPGVVSYAEPCKYTFLWFKWGCTAYTCENIGCDSDFAQRVCPNKCSECTTVVDIAIDGGFLLLVEFVAKANLVEILQSAGPFTVFAPDDAAFKALPAATLAKYRDDPDDIWSTHLIDLLLYHVVAGDIRSTDLTDGAVVETLSGESVNVDLNRGVFINDAAVIAVDNVAANGVVHVIDEVLLPTSATTTIFEIGEEVSTGDVPAFTTLMLLVDLADAAVKDALESNGPITLFAPTDAAFAKLDQATLTFLISETKEAKAALTEILTYHVVSGNVASTSLTQGLTATTVQGENIIVSSLNPPTINGNSLIIDTDILASNGIIHVINTVLLPKDLE